MPDDDCTPLRNLPSIGSLLEDPQVRTLAGGVPKGVLVELLRQAVGVVRGHVRRGACGSAGPEVLRAAVLEELATSVRQFTRPHYRRVINATGIVLHTGLGRAVLPPAAHRQIQEQLGGYSLLQVDIGTGERSRRDGRIEELLRQLTGAPAATVVNNNAAATFLVLATVARGREVIVSRGQLVEIGGSFRLPEVMAQSGARLVEVGTTNRTHPADYERAITDQTAAILRVHPSNYRIRGFTAEVPLRELVEIAHRRGLLLIDDVGAGALVDFSRFGFEPEPTLPEAIAAGADLVTASADKLIGGPQGGLILGREDLIQAVRKNPLARMVRVDKLTLAALEATLVLFLDEAVALAEVPTLRMLHRKVEELARQAERIAQAIAQQVPEAQVEVVEGFSQMGSGSLPGQDLPTRLVALASPGQHSGRLAARLRQHEPPVFARVHRERVLLDPRTVMEGEEGLLIEACVAALRLPP